MFLMWFDPSRKPAVDKIFEAAAAYLQRFGRPATVAYCNVRDLPLAPVVGMMVVPAPRCQPNTFQVGEQEYRREVFE